MHTLVSNTSSVAKPPCGVRAHRVQNVLMPLSQDDTIVFESFSTCDKDRRFSGGTFAKKLYYIFVRTRSMNTNEDDM